MEHFTWSAQSGAHCFSSCHLAAFRACTASDYHLQKTGQFEMEIGNKEVGYFLFQLLGIVNCVWACTRPSLQMRISYPEWLVRFQCFQFQVEILNIICFFCEIILGITSHFFVTFAFMKDTRNYYLKHTHLALLCQKKKLCLLDVQEQCLGA